MMPPGALAFALLLLISPWVLGPRPEREEIHGVVRILWWLNLLYCKFWHRLELEVHDPMPTRGAAVLVSNHTCCIDHMLLQAGTRRLLGFIIAKEIYEIPWFRPFCDLSGCIPVKRDGHDLAGMRAALRALKEGRVLPIFPEGRITPSSGRELGEGKAGAAYIALRAGVPVIPAFIRGTPSTNQIGPSLRTPSHAYLTFGPPIDLSDLAAVEDFERETLDEVTARLMGAIRALRDQNSGLN